MSSTQRPTLQREGCLDDAEWDCAVREAREAMARSPWGRFYRVFADGEPAPIPPSEADLLRRLADAEALTTQLMAQQCRDLLELRRRRLATQRAEGPPNHDPESCTRGCCDPDGWMTLEVGQTLAVTERQVEQRLDTAERLDRFAHLRAAVEDGLVQAWTARTLAQHLSELAALLPADRLERIEQATVAWLTDSPRTVGQVNARMRRLLVAAREAAGESQQRRDARDRRVHLLPADAYGLATLVARLPEGDALAVQAVLRALAVEPTGSDDTRTQEQRRCDLLTTSVTGLPAAYGHAGDTDLVVRGPGSLGVHLDVTVPADALTIHTRGDSDRDRSRGAATAQVAGYGSVVASTVDGLLSAARGNTSCRALVYDPATGHLLGLSRLLGSSRLAAPAGTGSVSTKPGAADRLPMAWLDATGPAAGYEHPPVMERLVKARDVTCRAPACTRRAIGCDCDHVVPYPRGETSVANTCCLCRRHHRLKTHAPGWSTSLDQDGRLVWTTPVGRRLTTEPYDYSEAGA